MFTPNRWLALVATTLLALATLPAAAAVIPIEQYTFNETGTTAASTGSDATAVTMFNSGATATDLHGAAGSGVSGAPNDLAFDNTASTGMGFPNSGGYANQGDNNSIDGLQSLTLQGWYKASAPPADGARLFSNIAAGNGFDLLGGTSGTNLLTLTINSDFSDSSEVFTSADDNTWVFFAVTYDSTTGDVNFYKGTSSLPVSNVGIFAQTINGATGPAADNSAGLAIGNYTDPSVAQRPLDGLMDDMRIFGSKTDSSGVLSLTDLEAIREADLIAPPAPEPTACSILAIGIALVGSRRSTARG